MTGEKTIQAAKIQPSVNSPAPSMAGKLALGFFPLTPVPFNGPDKLIAWGRLACYSMLAYYTFNKMKPVSYGFMTAAGLSLATSITSAIWPKKE